MNSKFLLTLAAVTAAVRFAYISDNHFSFGSPSVKALRECIQDINRQDSLDFVLFGGDITDFGADDEIHAVKQMMDSLRYKYYVVAGNHDAKWSESGCNTFKEVFGYEHFEFEVKGWRFLGCNCGPDMRMAPALIPRESMEWLEGLEPGKKSIFVNHYPQDTSVLNYFDVTKQLKRIGVQFEIGGHWHNNHILNYDGIPAVLGRSSMADNRKPVGYNIFEITEDGHVTVSERRLVDGKFVQLSPWYSADLGPIQDTVHYDGDGIADSYPWMRYDVNKKYPQVREVWKIQESANVAAGFARDGNFAWYTTSSGGVSMVSLRNGAKQWSRLFPGKIFSTPAISGRYLVFGCTDGFIYALDAYTGTTLWSFKAGHSVLGSPVIFDGKVFVGASDGCFRALDLYSGDLVWNYADVKGFVECKAYVDADQVVFGSWGNSLYSLDTKTGQLQWIWHPEKTSRMYSPAAVWPVKAAGRIFIAVPDRRVYAIDASTGSQLFWVDGGREAIGLSSDGSTVYAKTMFHKSYAFRADVAVPPGGCLPEESLLWKVENGSGYEIGPTAISEENGMVITPTDKGNIFALSAVDGSLLWYHKLSLALVNPLQTWTAADGKTYILASTMDGAVSLLEVYKQ